MTNDTMESFVRSSSDMKWVSPDTKTVEIFTLMKKNKIHHLPVVDNGKAVGIISDRDVSFVDKAGDAFELSAKDIMTEGPVSVDRLTTIPHAVQLMRQNKVNSVLVHDDKEKLIGIFTSADVMDILLDTYK